MYPHLFLTPRFPVISGSNNSAQKFNFDLSIPPRSKTPFLHLYRTAPARPPTCPGCWVRCPVRRRPSCTGSCGSPRPGTAWPTRPGVWSGRAGGWRAGPAPPGASSGPSSASMRILQAVLCIRVELFRVVYRFVSDSKIKPSSVGYDKTFLNSVQQCS